MQRSKELWIKQTKHGRARFRALQEKYFGIEQLIQKGGDPLGAMVTRAALSN